MIDSSFSLTVDTNCNCIKQLKHFTAVLAFCFGWNKNSFNWNCFWNCFVSVSFRCADSCLVQRKWPASCTCTI